MAAARKKAIDEAPVEDEVLSSASADSESSEGSELDVDGYEPDDDLYGDDDLDQDLDEDDDLPTTGEEDFDEDADEPLPEEEDDDVSDSEDGPLLLSKDEEFEVFDEDEEDDVEVEGLREGEFICSDCRMVYRLTALADEAEMLCRDCV